MILPSEWVDPKRSARFRKSLGRLSKREIDVSFASVGILILLPVFVLIAIGIKLDSQGPVFYSQERIGHDRRWRRGCLAAGGDRRHADAFGRPFMIRKFRTMVANAERDTGPVWASARDSRVTRVGRFLRRTRLDETAQLWNVLRGEMSLVGPRPERPTFVKSLAASLPDYPERYSALPGITGLAQVKSDYDTSLESVHRKLQYDLYYLKNGCLLLDLRIMAASVKVMANGHGAH